MKKKLHDSTKGDRSMENYLREIKSISDNLAASNVIVDDEDLVLHTLNGLPHEYNALGTYVRARPHPITLEELNDLLISEEIYVLKQSHASFGGQPSDFHPTEPTMALQAHRSHFQASKGGSISYSRGRGYYRNARGRGHRGRGHYRGGHTSHTDTHISCQICGRPNHSAIDCWFRHDQGYPSSTQSPQPPHQALIAATTSQTTHPQWYFDSGTSHHVTSDLSNLTTQQESYNGHDSVSVGNGSSVQIHNTGSGQVFEENTVHRPL